MKLGTDILFFVIVMAVAWPLSAWDRRVTGENRTEDLIHRLERCAITLVLLFLTAFNGYYAIFIFASIAIYWAGTASEFLAERFHRLMDPHDDRAFDPKHAERGLEQFAQLVHQGRTREALDLYQKLEHSRDVSLVALEAALHRFYRDTLDSISNSVALEGIRRLRGLGQFDEAESQLKRMVELQPNNVAAMLLLMRVYVEDLNRPDKALALLELVEKQPRLHPALAKYARGSIGEWSRAGMSKKVSEPVSFEATSSIQASSRAAVKEVSVDEMLKEGQLTLAIEFLEKITREEPGNFDAWMKLAEAHGIYCADLNKAGKIIRAMELSSNFSPEEIVQAREKLKEWHAARR